MKQCVQFNGVPSGMPEGSILGPLRFCINDLPNFLNVDSNFYLYAGDAKLFRHISTSTDGLLLQDDINQFTNWTDK